MLIQIRSTLFSSKQVHVLERGYRRLLIYHQIKNLAWDEPFILDTVVLDWEVIEASKIIDGHLIRSFEIVGDGRFIVSIIYDAQTKERLVYTKA